VWYSAAIGVVPGETLRLPFLSVQVIFVIVLTRPLVIVGFFLTPPKTLKLSAGELFVAGVRTFYLCLRFLLPPIGPSPPGLCFSDWRFPPHRVSPMQTANFFPPLVPP